MKILKDSKVALGPVTGIVERDSLGEMPHPHIFSGAANLDQVFFMVFLLIDLT